MYRNMAGKTVRFCHVGAVALAFFMNNLPTIANVLPTHLNLKPDCPTGWKAIPNGGDARTCTSGSEETQPPLSTGFKQCPTNLEMGYRCSSPTMKGMIVGPLRTKPETSWKAIRLPFKNLLKRGDKIVSFLGGAMAASGDPVPYPPLHIHHLHVIHEGSDHNFETHGDYKMDREGYNSRLPPGSCYVFDGANGTGEREGLNVASQINDVRYTHGSSMSNTAAGMYMSSNASDAQEVEWFFRVVFRLTTEPCQLVNKIVGFWPVTKFSMKDGFSRYDVGNTERIYWWRYRMPMTGKMLLPSYLHSHRGRFAGFLLVRGRHSLGSLTGIGGTDGPGASDCNDLECARDLIIRASGEKLICYDNKSVPTFIKLNDSADGSIGGYYDRFGEIDCTDFTFKENDVVTLFWFSAPKWAAEQTSFAQHSMFFNYYIPQDDATDSGFSQTIELFTQQYGLWDVGSNTYNSSGDDIGWVPYKKLTDPQKYFGDVPVCSYSAESEHPCPIKITHDLQQHSTGIATTIRTSEFEFAENENGDNNVPENNSSADTFTSFQSPLGDTNNLGIDYERIDVQMEQKIENANTNKQPQELQRGTQHAVKMQVPHSTESVNASRFREAILLFSAGVFLVALIVRKTQQQSDLTASSHVA